MTGDKLIAPERGDVFARATITEGTLRPGPLRRLFIALGLSEPDPVRVFDVEYRQVIDNGLGTVLYRDADDGELHGTWLAEWYDWVIGAHLVANNEGSMDPDELEELTGSREIPYELFNKRGDA